MKTFQWNNKKTGNFKFYLDDKTFIPTQTTSAITEAAIESIDCPLKVLDLGCGCGIVAILLSKRLPFTLELFASDLSDTVQEIVSKNAEMHDVKIITKQSNIFKNWKGYKFDAIINDISGVSELNAELTPWFKNISCKSGKGGDILVNKVIKESKNYLNDGGFLIFPIISFSNKKSILLQASKYFGSVELLKRDEWPVPPEMKNHISLLKDLKKDHLIDYEEKFGMLIGYTEVYRAKNPNSF